jgi:hypothetical protein
MENFAPIPRNVLIERGTCCGCGCTNCPYEPRHEKGSKQIRAIEEEVSYPEELNESIDQSTINKP